MDLLTAGCSLLQFPKGSSCQPHLLVNYLSLFVTKLPLVEMCNVYRLTVRNGGCWKDPSITQLYSCHIYFHFAFCEWNLMHHNFIVSEIRDICNWDVHCPGVPDQGTLACSAQGTLPPKCPAWQQGLPPGPFWGLVWDLLTSISLVLTLAFFRMQHKALHLLPFMMGFKVGRVTPELVCPSDGAQNNGVAARSPGASSLPWSAQRKLFTMTNNRRGPTTAVGFLQGEPFTQLPSWCL